MTEPNKKEARQPTEAEIQYQKHIQHLHRVFGRDTMERNESQRYVVSCIKETVSMPTFLEGCNTKQAAMREGERNYARALLNDIGKDPIALTEKPNVNKG